MCKGDVDEEYSEDCERMARMMADFAVASGIREAAQFIMGDAKNVFERGDNDHFADRLRTIAKNLKRTADTRDDETRERNKT